MVGLAVDYKKLEILSATRPSFGVNITGACNTGYKQDAAGP
jgi:hypothetical protein